MKTDKNIRKINRIIKIAEHINTNILGWLTIFFLIISFSSQLLSLFEFNMNIPHSVLTVVEVVARILAVALILTGGVLYYYKFKLDGYRKIWKTLRARQKDQNINSSLHKNRSTFFSRFVCVIEFFEDIQALTILGAEAYAMNNVPKSKRNIRYGDWWKMVPQCFVLFEDEFKRIIGFISVLPLDDTKGSDGYKHYKGNREEFEIDNRMIVNRLSTLILLQGIWLQPAFLNDALEAFLERLYEHLASFMHKDEKLIEATKIYVEPISFYNAKFLKEIGFVKTGKSKSGNKIYELDFSENADENDKGYHTKQRIKYYLKKRKP